MTKKKNLIYRMIVFLIRIICRINGGLVVEGVDNIPSEGGVIVASNHISYIDPPVLGAVIPRHVTFMARRGLFEIPVLKWIVKRNAIPVDRGRTSPSTIKESIKRLNNRELIVMFPEGRRSETGKLLEAKRGVGMIAGQSRVTVVPAVISGADKVLPVDARWLHRARIHIVFGKPINFQKDLERTHSRNHVLHKKISDRIMTAIRDLKTHSS